MEKKEISIYNPNVKPYGRLSNNYKTNIPQKSGIKKINIKNWGTVNGFIYGNLVKTIKNTRLIHNISTNKYNLNEMGEKQKIPKKYKNISKLFIGLISEEKEIFIKKAIIKAYEDILLNNQHGLQDILLGIKASKIKYVSVDKNLGTGENNGGNGKNILGKTLVSIRKKIINKVIFDEQKQKDQMYKDKMYCYYLIQKELKTNHLHTLYSEKETFERLNSIKDLIEKLNISLKNFDTCFISSEIVNKNSGMGKEAFVELLDSDYQLKDIKPLLNMVYNTKGDNRKLRVLINGILKLNIVGYTENQKTRVPSLILKNYINYTMELDPVYGQLSNEMRNKCLNETLYNSDLKRINKLKSDLLKLYNEKRLPLELLSKIDEEIKILDIPSASKIKNILDFEIEYDSSDKNKPEDKRLEGTFILSDKKPYNHTYKYLLPFIKPPRSTSKKIIAELTDKKIKAPFDTFVIDGKNFPTVMHFVYYYLFKNFLHYNLYYKKINKSLEVDMYSVEASYDILKSKYDNKFLSYKDIKKLYNEKYYEISDFNKKKLLRAALISKFKNRTLQDLLLSTSPKKIIWADKYDNFLGIGIDGDGKNEVGKMLDSLRDKIKIERIKERETGGIYHLTTNDISSLVNSNKIIKEWVKIKIKDICNVFNIMNFYSLENYNEEIIPSNKCRTEDKTVQKLIMGRPSLQKYKNTEKIKKIKKIQKIFREWVKTSGRILRSNVLKSAISIVIEKLYNKCSNIYYYSKQVNISIPEWFTAIVKSNKNFENSSYITISAIWRHIIVLLFYLIKNSNNTEAELIDLIAKSTYFLQNKQLSICNKIKFSESFSPLRNCIVLAMCNCVKNIISCDKAISECMDRKQKNNLYVTLKTARNLILGKNEPLIINEDKPVEIVKEFSREEFEKAINKQIEEDMRKKNEKKLIEANIREEDNDSDGMSPKDSKIEDLIMEALMIEQDDEIDNIYNVKYYIENTLKITEFDSKELAKGIVKFSEEIEGDVSISKNIKFARVKFFS